MAGKSNPKISIIMPAYKAEKFIGDVTRARLKELAGLGFPYELIVVIDGKSDATAVILAKIKNKNLKIFHYNNNHGKGFAVRYGMDKATGDYIGYVDAGHDIAFGNISNMVKRIVKGDVDAVLPSKWHKKSSLSYPLHRTIFSRIYNLFLRVFLRLPVSDTQVGAKIYTKALVQKVTPRLLVKRFAFEAEFLAVARHFGFNRFAEVPVKINADKHSTVRLRDGLHSFWDGLAVFYRLHIRHYYDRQLSFHKLSKKKELKNLILVV